MHISLIDSHAHLIWPSLFSQIDDVMQKAKDANVENVINTGVQISDFPLCIELNHRFPHIKQIIGLHPEFSVKSENDPKIFQELFLQNRSIFHGIGEIGLDFWAIKDNATRNLQERIFRVCLAFASECHLPIVIHCRNAEKQAIAILESSEYSAIPQVVMHCFGGPEKYIKKCLDHENWYFTIPTSVVYKKLHQDLTKLVPLERMLLETDAPFLPPSNDIKINEPQYVIYAAKKIAEIKSISFDEIAITTTQNSKKIFH